jgi:hypothetical protein
MSVKSKSTDVRWSYRRAKAVSPTKRNDAKRGSAVKLFRSFKVCVGGIVKTEVDCYILGVRIL